MLVYIVFTTLDGRLLSVAQLDFVLEKLHGDKDRLDKRSICEHIYID